MVDQWVPSVAMHMWETRRFTGDSWNQHQTEIHCLNSVNLSARLFVLEPRAILESENTQKHCRLQENCVYFRRILVHIFVSFIPIRLQIDICAYLHTNIVLMFEHISSTKERLRSTVGTTGTEHKIKYLTLVARQFVSSSLQWQRMANISIRKLTTTDA